MIEKQHLFWKSWNSDNSPHPPLGMLDSSKATRMGMTDVDWCSCDFKAEDATRVTSALLSLYNKADVAGYAKAKRSKVVKPSRRPAAMAAAAKVVKAARASGGGEALGMQHEGGGGGRKDPGAAGLDKLMDELGQELCTWSNDNGPGLFQGGPLSIGTLVFLVIGTPLQPRKAIILGVGKTTGQVNALVFMKS